MGRILNVVVSWARGLWYDLIEPVLLRHLRAGHKPKVSTNPLVSVYIPTHSRCDLLMGRALKSVLAQTYKRIEVIVVAHGCTDGTHNAVNELMRVDRRVRLIRLPRKQTYPPTLENHWFAGRVAAANAGLAACRGEWIATIDDDDVWDAEHLDSSLAVALSGRFEFVSAAGDTPLGAIRPYVLDGVKVGPIQTWVYRSYLKEMKFNPQCWRKSWNKVCDTDLQDRFRRAGVRMGYLNRCNVLVLPRPGNTQVGLKAATERADVYMKHLEF